MKNEFVLSATEQAKYTPLEAAVAVSLYSYNVSPAMRAKAIVDYFQGACMEHVDLVNLFIDNKINLPTELPMPTTVVYIEQACSMYGEEARERVRNNLIGYVPKI